MKDSLFEEHILQLEKQLMSYEYEELATLLADDFMEFGSSGNVYDKKIILDSSNNRFTPANVTHMTITDFKIKLLSPAVILATYRTMRRDDRQLVLRSSIWKLNEGNWQMTFHQGTPTT